MVFFYKTHPKKLSPSSYGSLTLTLLVFNATFLSPVCASQSCLYAYFNVGFQPYVVAYDKRVNIDHTSNITTAEDIGWCTAGRNTSANVKATDGTTSSWVFVSFHGGRFQLLPLVTTKSSACSGQFCHPITRWGDKTSPRQTPFVASKGYRYTVTSLNLHGLMWLLMVQNLYHIWRNRTLW